MLQEHCLVAVQIIKLEGTMLMNTCLTCIFFNLQNQKQLEAKPVQEYTFLFLMWSYVEAFLSSNQELMPVSHLNYIWCSLLQTYAPCDPSEQMKPSIHVLWPNKY